MERSSKTAFLMAWNFYFGNIGLTLAVVGIFTVLVILAQLLGPLGLIFESLMMILLNSVLSYYAHFIPTLGSPEEMEDIARGTTLSDLFFQRIAEGTGIFLAELIIALLFTAFFYLLLYFNGAEQIQYLMEKLMIAAQSGNEKEYEVVFAQIFDMLKVPLGIGFLVVLFFSYVALGVFGGALKADGFQQSFLRVFRLFWPKYWLGTFRLSYMLLAGGMILYFFGIGFVFLIAGAVIVFITGIVANFSPLAAAFVSMLLIVVAQNIVGYFGNLFLAGVAVFADDIALGGTQEQSL